MLPETTLSAQVRAAYVETLSRIYRSALSKYVLSLGQLQVEVAGKGDLLGALEEVSHRAKGRASVFALGDRAAAVLRDLETAPPLIFHQARRLLTTKRQWGLGCQYQCPAHYYLLPPPPNLLASAVQAEAAGERHPYEVLFRSTQKLLTDSATSEYLFCHDFWAGDAAIFREIFAPALAAVEESLVLFLGGCHDVGALILLLRVNAGHQAVMARRRAPCLDAFLDRVNALLWPRLKQLFDAHTSSVRAASERALLPNTAQLGAHPVVRRFADLAASLHPLQALGGEAQGLAAGLERLRAVVCDLLMRMGKLLGARKRQMVFFINNFEAVVAVLRAASQGGDPGCEGADATPLFAFFSEGLARQTHLLVDEELADQFNPLMAFVQSAEAAYKAADAAGQPRAPLPQFGPDDAAPLLRDFAVRWQTSLDEIHRSIVGVFGPGQRSHDILQRTLSQLLLFYTRLTGPEGVLATYCGAAGAALCRDAVPTNVILAAIKSVVFRDRQVGGR